MDNPFRAITNFNHREFIDGVSNNTTVEITTSVALDDDVLNKAANDFYSMMVVANAACRRVQEGAENVEVERHRVIVVFDNDPDGYASVNLFTNLMVGDMMLPAEMIEFIPITHGLPFNNFVEGLEEKCRQGGEYGDVKMIVILDHGVERLTAKLNYHQGDGSGINDIYFAVIDHHPGSLNFASSEILDLHAPSSRRRMVYHSTRWSTSMLMFQLMYSIYAKFATAHNGNFQRAAMIATLVDYYDTWKFGQNPGDPIEAAANALCSLAFQEGFENIPWGDMIDGSINIGEVLNAGLKLVETKAKVANKVATKSVNKRLFAIARCSELIQQRVGVIFHSDDIDNIAATALAIHKDIDLAVVIYLKPGADSFKLAFRSRKDGNVDVSKIADLFGGGGHPCSAGAQIDDIAEFFNITQAIES